jgi:hypothetical protein
MMLATGTFDCAPEMEGPRAMAARLAKSCKDASTIRAAVNNSFWPGAAPELATINNHIQYHRLQSEKRKAIVGEPTVSDGVDWRPKGIVKPAKSERIQPEPRTRDFIHIEADTTPVAPIGNPWMKRHQIFSAVFAAVAFDFGISTSELTGKCHKRIYTVPRAVAAKLLNESGQSIADIGRRMGGRDHSTISHQINNIFPRIDRDAVASAIYTRHCRLRAEADATLAVMMLELESANDA